MMAINGHRVIDNFEVSEVYLLHPAKKIFRKFPKIAFLKNIFEFASGFLLSRFNSSKKNQCFQASLDKYIMHLVTKKSLFRPSL